MSENVKFLAFRGDRIREGGLNLATGADNFTYAPNYNFKFFGYDNDNPSAEDSSKAYLQVSQVTKDYLNPFGKRNDKVITYSAN